MEALLTYLKAGGERRYGLALLDHFGDTPLVQIDQAAIDRAAETLKPEASAATRNRQIYTPMSAVLKHAAKRGLCEWRRVERPRQAKAKNAWLRPDEAERLIEACAPHVRPLVTFLLGTGARLGEALYLDWAGVSLADRRVWFIDTKNGEARGVPLNKRVFLELANLPQRDGPVFRTHKGAPYARRVGGGGQLATAFNAACRRAGICRVRLIRPAHPSVCRERPGRFVRGAVARAPGRQPAARTSARLAYRCLGVGLSRTFR